MVPTKSRYWIIIYCTTTTIHFFTHILYLIDNKLVFKSRLYIGKLQSSDGRTDSIDLDVKRKKKKYFVLFHHG